MADVLHRSTRLSIAPGASADARLARDAESAPGRRAVAAPAESRREEESAHGRESLARLADFFRPGAEPVPGYQLVERLGRGGFGEVWRALGPGGFPAALKLVRLEERTGNTELRALEMLRGVGHPNLLALFGAWQRDGWLIIAMELADRTLGDRHREAVGKGLGGIPYDELLEYMHEAAKGIDFLNSPRHGKSRVAIQHRDIKPENLLLVGDSVKVADFGLARLLESTNASHSGSLTVGYAAPEFFNRKTSRWSDQYSLAATYCHLRGGRPPFTGSAVEVMAGHLMHAPDLVMLPEAERGPVARALSKEPKDRWPNCKAFVTALAAVATGNLPSSLTLKPAPESLGGLRTEVRLQRTGELRALEGHTDVVWGVAYSPDGRRALSASADHTLRLWSVDSGKTLRRLLGHDDCVRSVAFSADSKLALSGGDDRTLRLWDVRKGKELRRFEGHRATVYSVAFGFDGRRALSGSWDKTVRLWDLESGAALRCFEGHARPEYVSEYVYNVAFSPDGRRVLSCDGTRSVRLWDVETGKELLCFEGHTSVVNSVAFSPGGRHALSGSRDKSVRLWDVESGRELQCFEGHAGPVHSMAFSPDGRFALYGGSDREVRLWDMDTGQELHRFQGHTDMVTSVAFSPCGRYALSGSYDKTLRLWALPS